MTVDELIAALEDAKRLDPTIGGWEVAAKPPDVWVPSEVDGSAWVLRVDGAKRVSDHTGPRVEITFGGLA